MAVHCMDFCIITGEDYTILTKSPLILSTEFLNATILVDIVDDDLFEPAESFEISLFFKGQIVISRVTLDPRTAEITIQGIKFNVLVIVSSVGCRILNILLQTERLN